MPCAGSQPNKPGSASLVTPHATAQSVFQKHPILCTHPFFPANAAHPTSCLRQQKDLSTQSTTWSISRAQPCTSLYTDCIHQRSTHLCALQHTQFNCEVCSCKADMGCVCTAPCTVLQAQHQKLSHSEVTAPNKRSVQNQLLHCSSHWQWPYGRTRT